MNAIALQSWTTEVQSFMNKAAFYAPIVWKAFNKTIAPVTVSAIKGLAIHWFESECYWRQKITGAMGVTYNPLTAAIKAAYRELTSTEAQATYKRIRSVAHEVATDTAVIGLCGIVAISEGIELAQKVYRQAKVIYAKVDNWFNPVPAMPIILPTVEMALEPAPIFTTEDEEYEQEFMARLQQLDAVAVSKEEDFVVALDVPGAKTKRAPKKRKTL